MSSKQKVVIESIINEYKLKNTCEICENGNTFLSTDYFFKEENGPCPMCEYVRVKFMEDKEPV